MSKITLLTIRNGTNYEIDTAGTVTLEDGFIVEKGATFIVHSSF
jgi:hypothetical protein